MSSNPKPEPATVKLAPKAVVGRVCLYLRQLELLHGQGEITISSAELGAPLSIKNAQVRKDLAYFGQFGHPGIGYQIDDLIGALRHVLGVDHEWPLALVGFGNLGRALLGYHGFRSRGFKIVAIFDADPAKIGRKLDRLVIEPLESLLQVVAARQITLALLCVPAEVAQSVADRLVAAGIVGIFNFAPTPIHLPEHVSLIGVDLGAQLENLAYKVEKSRELAPRASQASSY